MAFTQQLYGDPVSLTTEWGPISGGGGGVLGWVEVTLGMAMMTANYGYITNNAGQVSLLMPATAAQGTVIRVTGKGAGGWKIAQQAGQTIYFGVVTTTTGVGGYLSSTQQRDSIEIVCITANTEWNVLSIQGNVTFN
jgi:hypothetical protein